MKKFIALALAAILAMAAFTACSGGDDSSSQSQSSEKPAYDVAAVHKTIEDANPIRMSKAIDDTYMEYLETISSLTPDMYDAYSGSYCPVSPGVDIILVVQAKADMAEDVAAALTEVKDSIYAANENYVGALRDKAEAGRVVTKGDYVVLVIAGDETVVEDEGVEKAYEPVDAAIDEAFK